MPTINQLNKDVETTFTKIDQTKQKLSGKILALQDGTDPLGAKLYKQIFVFALYCQNNPDEASELEEWGDVKSDKRANSFHKAVKYVYRHQLKLKPKLKSHISAVAGVFEYANDNGIAPDTLTTNLKKNGGMSSWYRAIPKPEAELKRMAKAERDLVAKFKAQYLKFANDNAKPNNGKSVELKQQFIAGESQNVLKRFDANSFDSCLTDPPYGIGLLGKKWDDDVGNIDAWREVYRVLKPGAYCLAFGATRTVHRLTTLLESIGFIIKDQLMWCKPSGFPKGQDQGEVIKKKSLGIDLDVTDLIDTWTGYKPSLKSAYEPILLVQKPLDGPIIDNLMKWGVGALNIDETRIPLAEGETYKPKSVHNTVTFNYYHEENEVTEPIAQDRFHPNGRYPSNMVGEIDGGGYQKYFFCPKVTKLERNLGFNLPESTNTRGQGEVYGANGDSPLKDMNKQPDVDENGEPLFNNHPCLKPIELLQYLGRLITPAGGKTLDPFAGSGSAGIAARIEGFNYIGIEEDAHFTKVSNQRLKAWREHLESDEAA